MVLGPDEVIVADDQAAKVISTIVAAARTGQIGDGKLFVSDIAEAIRIRTGENGSSAL